MPDVKLRIERGVVLPGLNEVKTWVFLVGKRHLMLECRYKSALLVAKAEARHQRRSEVYFLGSYKW